MEMAMSLPWETKQNKQMGATIMGNKTWDFTNKLAQLNVIVENGKNAKSKSKEEKAGRRAQRKIKQINAMIDLIANCDTSQLKQTTLDYITSLTNVKQMGKKCEFHVGDTIMELMTKYPTTKNLYKKIMDWCIANGCHIANYTITHDDNTNDDNTNDDNTNDDIDDDDIDD